MHATRWSLCLLAGLIVPRGLAAEEVRGQITKVDLARKELFLEGRLKARGMTFTFRLNADTKVLFGSRPGTLEDLEPGRRARIDFEGVDEALMARVIRVSGSAPARAMPASAPPARGDGSTVTGVLQRVALTDREIVVIGPGAKGPETETTISVPEKVPIQDGDQALAFDALAVGATVSVQVEVRQGKLTALAIQVGKGVAAGRPEAGRTLPKLRMLLRLAEQVLDQMDRDRGP